MWNTQNGVRTLHGAEAALFREGLWSLWDDVELDFEDPDLDRSGTGVELFDKLQPSQMLAMLADVGEALLTSTQPAPDLTAVNEACVGAVFEQIRANLHWEIDDTRGIVDSGGDAFSTRRLVLAAMKEVDAGPLPPGEVELAIESSDLGRWDIALLVVSDAVLWDRDFEDADSFVDRPPLESAARKHMMSIEDDYYLAVAPDPRESELPAIRERLRKLVERAG